MDTILEALGINSLDPALRNRLVFSGFCLLIAVILLYFWYISLPKIKATKQDGKGLVYLAFAFVLFAVIGVVSTYSPGSTATMLIISGLISCCFLSSLSYFSLQDHWLDRLVHLPAFKNGIKYFAFGWVIAISLAPDHPVTRMLDTGLAVISILTLGFFLARYFRRRRLNFIAVLAAIYFLGFALLQVLPSAALDGGKFVHVNTAFLSPAIALAVIVLAYTFNWINELSFYELSSIWTNDAPAPGASIDPATENAAVPGRNRAERWIEMLAADELETVIQEIIIAKKHRNETLEHILGVASRNTRNNNNHLKGIIKYEDYQLNRNQLGEAVLAVIQRKAG